MNNDLSNINLSVTLNELGDKEKRYQLSFTAAERAEVAKRFDIPAVVSARADVCVIGHNPDKGIRITGTVMAELTVVCVASLDHIKENIHTDMNVILFNSAKADQLDQDEAYLDPNFPEYDALEDETILIGEVVVQTISMAMEPFPRSAGAQVDLGDNHHISLGAPETEKPNPFAKLEKLRDKS